MQSNKACRIITALITLLYMSASTAGTLSVPNSFSSGNTTSAADMNSNFSAVTTAVNDNDSRITALETSSDKVFQGFSSETVTGAAGIFAMAQACSSSFSGSKICNTNEFVNSVYNSAASNLSGNAWIIPIVTGQDTTGLEVNSGRSEVSEVNLNCSGWGNINSQGSIVSSTGRLIVAQCNLSIAVACCK
jgi:hypothetical protein